MEPIFAFALPLELAPTMNTYANMKPWQRTKTKAEIAKRLIESLRAVPQANGARRKIVVTRFSSAMLDEVAVDLVGGKCVVDVLVKLGALAGDSQKHLEREARWKRCAKGEGRLVVEISEA